ncbi:fidgetin-like protein 1 [Oppia nitens]|uniref:fidgetin-like protein 1 n=1 Tax=Oppia nitens TaxID=1686743 RepID=UPI0023DC19E8|nr:fidgetin-like protein 1 [Oppia nitens]
MSNTRSLTSGDHNHRRPVAMMTPDIDHLIDCEMSEQLASKSDALRSALFAVTAAAGQHRPLGTGNSGGGGHSRQNADQFQQFRCQLMNELNTEMDREDGKNSFVGSRSETVGGSQQHSGGDRFQSRLAKLPERQLLAKLGIRPKTTEQMDYDDCQVVSIVLNNNTVSAEQSPPPIVDNSCDINSSMKSSTSCSSSSVVTNKCNTTGGTTKLTTKTSILDKVGSFRGPSMTTNTVKPITSSAGSPTRVSGIFRSSGSPKTKQKIIRSLDVVVSTTNASQPSKPSQQQQPSTAFMTGLEKKYVEDVKKGSVDMSKAAKSLREVKNTFKPPMKYNDNNNSKDKRKTTQSTNDDSIDPHLRNIDPQLIEVIENEIITKLEPIGWSDVAGLEFAKNKIKEIAVLPLQRPDLFSGLRKPPKGILLFGPPGTGKTFLGRCIASQTKSTFFSITVSSLNSKWIGEGEKTIRAMFAVARARQPSVIFIDEIDSLLKTRSDTEHESSRRMKTEFLAQYEGVGTDSDKDKILIIGATNRPQELDDAARRRLNARLYIRLPDSSARQQIVANCLRSEKHSVTDQEIEMLANMTDGYSCADMRDLCRESAMEPIRDSTIMDDICNISAQEIRDISYNDFLKSMDFVRPTVRKEDLVIYEKWNQEFGTHCLNIKLKAKEIAINKSITGFKASDCWCNSFMRRNKLSVRAVSSIGQKLPQNWELKMAEFMAYMNNNRDGVQYQHIGNMDEVPVSFDIIGNFTVDSVGAKEVKIKSTGNEKFFHGCVACHC